MTETVRERCTVAWSILLWNIKSAVYVCVRVCVCVCVGVCVWVGVGVGVGVCMCGCWFVPLTMTTENCEMLACTRLVTTSVV